MSSNDSVAESIDKINNPIFNQTNIKQISEKLNKINGFFTENQGQIDNNSVKYYIQGKDIWFLDNAVVFQLVDPIKSNNFEEGFPNQEHLIRFKNELDKTIQRKNVVLKLNFEGANRIIPEGRGLLPHRSNFFFGNNSQKWCINVPNFQEIIYENLYDNIDLRYYMTNEGLKYDFIVHPNGTINDILLKYEGTQGLQLDTSGNLRINTSFGDIIDSNLVIYQNSNLKKRLIHGEFMILDSNSYGFKLVGEYEKNMDLIIDPLVYSTFIGGTGSESGDDIAIDSQGYAYVVGETSSSNFPISSGAYDSSQNGIIDLFMLKLNQNGSSIIYSTYIGGSSSARPTGIALNSNGDAYATGWTDSSNFPTTNGANDTTFGGGSYDGFVLKLNQTGTSLLYSTFVGGNGEDYSSNIAVDKIGNAYITGITNSLNFPITFGTYNTTFNGGLYDAFALKLNLNGSTVIYSTYLGGNQADYGRDIVIDNMGNAYLVGETISGNFPTTPGAYDTSFNVFIPDIFVLKLNQTGSTLIYSTAVGGSHDDRGSCIVIDSMGNAYVGGRTKSTDFPNTTGAYDNTHNGDYDCLVFKLNQTGSTLIYSTYIGGTNADHGQNIAIDTRGNAYITGWTKSSNFPTTSNALNKTYCGGISDVILLKLNQTGGSLNYSTFIGGDDYEFDGGVNIDTTNKVYATGRTESTNFPTTSGANDTSHNGGSDCFVLKLSLTKLYPPKAIDLKISKSFIRRTNEIYLYSNATDIEDREMNLTPIFEYRDPNEKVWNNTNFSNLQYNNSYWEISFKPAKNATLGLYDFRVKFVDSDILFSPYYYLNDSLTVLNNFPLTENLILSQNRSLLGDNILIWINCTDIEDSEKDLKINLEYCNPNELSWDTIYLGVPKFINERWEFVFAIPLDALFGYYDFKARVNDFDGDYSQWFYLNDSLLILNKMKASALVFHDPYH